MAQVKIFGALVNADPVEELANGDWKMRSRAHTPRLAPGTIFIAKKAEIVEMAAAEMAPDTNSPGLAALEAGMAEERKTLPTPQELIAQVRAANTAATEPPAGRPLYSKPAVSVPPDPTSRP